MGGVDKRALGDVLVEVIDELLGSFGSNFFVVIAREEGATVLGIVFLEELLDTDELVR